jgi:cytochrome c-type biogenesis protein CcmH/NrfG
MLRLQETFMDGRKSEVRRLGTVQAYGLSAICLMTGIALGYFLHPYGAAAAGSPFVQAVSLSQAQYGRATPQPALTAVRAVSNPSRSAAVPAVQPLLNALRSRPDDTSLLARIAVSYGQARQFDIAAQYFQRAIQIKASAALYTDLAVANHFAGLDDKAEQALRDALAMDPNYPSALFNLGALRLRIHGDNQGAIELWQRLLKTNPDSPHRGEVEQMIARAREQMGVHSSLRVR